MSLKNLKGKRKGLVKFNPKGKISREDTDRLVSEGFSPELVRDVSATLGLSCDFSEPPGLSGDYAFMLHDTYGLPVDIIQDVCREQGVRFDRERFDKIMEIRQEESRKGKLI